MSPLVQSHSGSTVWLITKDNRASMVSTEKAITTDGVGMAVAGSGSVLIGGAKPALVPKDFILTAHPRTAVGVSKDGRYLIWLTIDGRQEGYSMGATLGEVADWLRRFGAHAGLNLEGGGSTAMVRAGAGGAGVLNHPSGAAKPGAGKNGDGAKGGGQRSNGNNFGVRAKPLGAAGAGR